ncbi:MAG: response regulator, partial [Proteobacteria bacterium]|nr:response regulator [Pseudomonadota bacterium]
MQKILIVDDTASNRFLLRTILTSAGYSVAESADGPEALSHCLNQPPALVLLDIMMPEMDGIEVCKRLRERFSAVELPVVVITSREEAEVLPEALRAGANDYIAKPINREVLLARVRSQLEIAAARQEALRSLEIQTTMMESLPQSLAIVGGDGVLVHANRSWKEAGGQAAPSPVTASFNTLFRGVFAGSLSEINAQLSNDADSKIDREIESTGDEARFVQIILRPIQIRGGERLTLWLLRDVTQTRELERKLNERIRLESVAMLVRGVAHNFNNILGGVLGAAEILERYLPEGDRPKRAMAVIRQGTQSAAKLTKKLSLFSGLGRSSDDLYVENLEEVLGAITLMTQEKVGDRITIYTRVAPGIPQMAIGVAQFIEVANHIIANSIDAIPGSGKIEIGARLHPSGKVVEVAICDTGIGMSPEIVARAFEPFFTTKNLDERNSIGIDGHGLGLWNVYNLLRACGGDISVQSKLGQGTTVVL